MVHLALLGRQQLVHKLVHIEQTTAIGVEPVRKAMRRSSAEHEARARDAAE
jgi:hypothetical protein